MRPAVPLAGPLLGLLLLLLVAGALLIGDGDLSDPELAATFLSLRVWRALCALLAGAGLAVAGVVAQGLFHNPLASPDVIGTSAGATLGGQAVLLLWQVGLGEHLPASLPAEMALPLGCLVGAFAALAILNLIAARVRDRLGVLLAGLLIGSVAISLGGLLTSLAMESWQLGRAILAFTLGGVEGRGPRHVLLALPMVGAAVLAVWAWGAHLDVALSGEDVARSLGVDMQRTRLWGMAWMATLTAAAVAIGGSVPFVGLVVPHMMRGLFGASHRRLVPAALLGGGAFVLACDLCGRLVPARGEVPLGVVTGLVGAPVFLLLLRRMARSEGA